MPDGEYFSVEGSTQEIRNVTERLASQIRSALVSDPYIPKMNFPRLRFLSMPGLGYIGADFRTVAKKIRPGGIRIYETKANYGYGGKFWSSGKFDFFAFAPEITANVLNNMKTIVHETTHAVQEWKKWRESTLDHEVDAHFATALYLVLKGRQEEVKHDTVMNYYIIGAEAYVKDPKSITSRWFRDLRSNMRNDVLSHYRFMNKKISPDFNEQEFDKDFQKKARPDGIFV
ncbi:MAG: hypothetical protein ABI878_03155 [Acidobacteriota bacterium]